MRAWWAAARLGAVHRFTWRMEALAAVIAALGVVIANASLWSAAAAEGPVAGMAPSALATYVVVAWIVAAAVGGRVEEWIGDRLVSGDVVADLVRPLDLHAWAVARHLGRSAASLALTAVPVFLLLGLWAPLALPRSVGVWAVFGLSVLLASLAGAQIGFLVGLLVLPVGQVRGLAYLKAASVWLLSGSLVPLAALPPVLHAVALWTPLPALAHWPATVFLGAHAGEALGPLASQGGWVVALALACRVAQQAALRRLVVWGG